MKKDKDVFISYSHADSDFVHKIAKDFKSKGLHVWLDEWDIQPGANITKTINEGLKASRYLLLFLSANAMKSRWVEEEWTSKYNDEINKNQITVIPVLIDSVDFNTLPPFLANKKVVNLSQDCEQTIKQTANFLLDEIRSFKEEQSLGSIKEILGKSGRKNFVAEIKKGIMQRIEKAKDKGWGVDRCLALITRELNFSFQEISIELGDKRKDYNEDPSEFGALQCFILHDDHSKLKNLKSKVEYIIADVDDPNIILEEILLELELLTTDDT